ncbi:MAG: hypothetical protein M5U28_06165 [Sandaracinaceae bacterium]|nr:hypothetical protein [Sandaracinaceae bacterium]
MWIPVDVASFEVSAERCETREGQTLVLRVRITTDICDEPGNARWTVDPAAREIRLSPFVWRRIGVPPCPPATRIIERDVALRGARLAAGEWTVVSPDGARLLVRIGPPPPELTCTDCLREGDSCSVDEECEGLRECVPIRGDAVCDARCASSCQPFSEEEGELDTDPACSERLGPSLCRQDANLGWTCAGVAGACATCPEGMACSGFCQWTVEPWPSPCRADGDCPLGKSCVELFGGRSCLVRCRGDHPLPVRRGMRPRGPRLSATEDMKPSGLTVLSRAESREEPT